MYNHKITVYPYKTLGHADHGWLDTRHHFSFASYYNPKRMGFGKLLVINDDRIAPGTGFGTHPHDNMEIITYVREGAVTHKDSMNNEGRTEAGDVQVMSAGTGVAHSEYNKEPVATHLFQIWIVPHTHDATPRWETQHFPKTPVDKKLHVLVSGMKEHEGKNALFIHQDAAVYGGRLHAGTTIEQHIKHSAYILASAGSFTVNGVKMQQGDGAEAANTPHLTIQAETDTEILIIDVPQ